MNNIMKKEIKKEIMKLKLVAGTTSFLIVFFMFITLGGGFSFAEEKEIVEQIQDEDFMVLNLNESYNERSDVFSGLEDKIQAKSVLIWDMTEGINLFSVNEDLSLPLASITKVMTALVALENSSPETEILIKADFMNQYGSGGFFVNDRWELLDILDGALTSSNNDAAFAAGSIVGALNFTNSGNHVSGNISFVSEMNRRSLQLGMNQTHFLNTTGLDENEFLSGADGSAYDVLKLFKYVIKNHPELLDSTRESSIRRSSLNGNVRVFDNTNRNIHNIPRLIGSKTGFTDLAGGNLTVAYEPVIGKPVIVVVLGSTFNGRFDDMNILIDSIDKYFN